MSVSSKAFHAAAGLSASAVLALAGWAIDAPLWLALLVTSVLAGGTVVMVRTVAHRARMLAHLHVVHRQRLARWVGVASVLHIGWVAGVQVAPEHALWWAVGLVGLAGAEWATAAALEYVWTQPLLPDRHAAIEQQQAAREEAAAAAVEPDPDMRHALRMTGLSWLRVIEWHPIGTAGRNYTVRIPAAPPDAKTGAKTLTASHAECIAIALSEVTGTPLMSDWVQVRKSEYAGQYVISVVTEDVKAKVIPYVDDPTPTSITEPCVTGYRLDGSRIEQLLAQHGETIGKSRSGKSSLINCKMAHVTRCDDAVLWICGTEKVYNLVGGWLAPYEGTDYRPPIDWVERGLTGVLAVLAAGMRLARHRQDTHHSQARDWTRIIIVLDEASFALSNNTETVAYDGKARTASEMAANIVKGAGGGNVHLWLATQHGVNKEFGDDGGTIKAQMGFAEVFQTRSKSELGEVFGEYKLSRPRHKGEYWADLGEGDLVNAKAPYIQETDPARPTLHDGATISDISWARRDLVMEQPLDAAERAAAGEAYINRRRSADDLVEYLTGKAPAAQNTAESTGYATAMTELDELLGVPVQRKEAATVATIQYVPADQQPVPTSRADRIVRIVGQCEDPISRADIITRLQDAGDPVRNTNA